MVAVLVVSYCDGSSSSSTAMLVLALAVLYCDGSSSSSTVMVAVLVVSFCDGSISTSAGHRPEFHITSYPGHLL